MKMHNLLLVLYAGSAAALLLLPDNRIEIMFWLVLLYFVITAVTGYLLSGMNRLVYAVDSRVAGPGKRLSIIRFTRLQPAAFRRQVALLPARSMAVLIKVLQFDFVFMGVLYPLMAMFAMWLLRYTAMRDLSNSHKWWYGLVIIAFLTGVMDVLENRSALRALRRGGGDTDVSVMRTASLLKWTFGAIYLVALLVLIGAVLYFRLRGVRVG